MNDATMERIGEISTEHFKAMSAALDKALPDDPPVILFTAAVGFQLTALVDGLEDDRDNGIKLLNMMLSDVGYQIVRTQ